MRGPFKRGGDEGGGWGGGFPLTLPPSGVRFWDPPLDFGTPPLPDFGTPPPILRFRSHFGVRGPFKCGGGPFTVQIKDVSLGGVGGVYGGGGALIGFGDPPLEFWDPPFLDFGTPPPPS